MIEGDVVAKEIRKWLAFEPYIRTWMKDGKYRKAYKALEGEFNVARAVIEARSQAGPTQ